MDEVRTLRTAIPQDKQIWDTFVDHPLQSWSWGEFRKNSGKTVIRMIEETKGRPTCAWQLFLSRLPFGYSIGYFPKGPALDNFMVDSLIRIGRQNRCISILCEPNTPIDTTIPQNTRLKISHKPLFTKHTFILDLTKSEKQLLDSMHYKTRYNIRVAQRRGVTIREDNSDKAFATYLKLSNETTHRQGFYAHDESYHRSMWKTLSRDGIAHLFTATFEKDILAAWIIFKFGKTIYYPYGASSRHHREVMAPTLLLWEIALWGKNEDCTAFDLWGALGPDPDPTDPWFGFHRFKEGFRPQLVEYSGSYEVVVSPFLYPIYTKADEYRWKVLNLLKRTG